MFSSAFTGCTAPPRTATTGAPLKNLGVVKAGSCSPVEVSIELPMEVPIDVVLGWVSVKCPPVVEPASIELPIEVPNEIVLGWGSRRGVFVLAVTLENAGSCTWRGDIGPIIASSPWERGRIAETRGERIFSSR